MYFISWLICYNHTISQFKIFLSEGLFFSNFTFPVDKTEADSDEATSKNARRCVFACNLVGRIFAVEVVVGKIGVRIMKVRDIILVKPEVPTLEDTDEYEAKQEVCGLEE